MEIYSNRFGWNALAFAKTLFSYFDFVTLSGHAENALNWPVLLDNAPSLHPEVMKIVFVFLLIGYGTKSRDRADA